MVKNGVKNPKKPYFIGFAGFLTIFKSGKKMVKKW